MATQLRHLLLPHPNVTIRVLPYTAGATAGLDGRWTMLEFPPGLGFDPEVYVESVAGDIYLESAPLTHRVSVIYEHVSAAAATPERSAGMIREACDRFDKEGQP